jgi:hypothetical protein
MVDQDADTSLFHHGSAAFRLASNAAYKIEVRARSSGPWFVADTGAYRIMLFRVDRRPETVASAIAVGDTVKGEALYPAGDIDEFTVTGSPGSQQTAWFRMTSNSSPQFSAVTLAVLDPATGASMAEVSAGVALPFLQTPAFTIPAGGSVRVRVAPTSGGSGAAVPYEFFVN